MNSVQIRLADPHEIEPALRLLLGNDHGPADPAIVRGFIADATARGVPLDRLRIAAEGSRLIWTALPIASAGRTGVLIEPNSRLPRQTDVVVNLIRQCCAELESHNATVIQVLLDPNERAAVGVHETCGFEDLAILEYLRLPASPTAPPLPASLELRQAPPDADLATALQLSYIDTLDCPRLNGLRSLPDVIDGYRHAHPYEPTLWHVLYEAGEPVGVLLLSRPSEVDPLELSYLGLAPQLRGRRIGALLLAHARATAARVGSDEVAITVDAQNEPAKRLYFRAGGRVILSRRVMIRTV